MAEALELVDEPAAVALSCFGIAVVEELLRPLGTARSAWDSRVPLITGGLGGTKQRRRPKRPSRLQPLSPTAASAATAFSSAPSTPRQRRTSTDRMSH
jgi:hypothetical protein